MWTCKNCNEKIEDQFDACWSCGYDKKGKLVAAPKEANKSDSIFIERQNSHTEYPFLRSFYEILYWLSYLLPILVLIIGALISFQIGNSKIGQHIPSIGIASILSAIFLHVNIRLLGEIIILFANIADDVRTIKENK